MKNMKENVYIFKLFNEGKNINKISLKNYIKIKINFTVSNISNHHQYQILLFKNSFFFLIVLLKIYFIYEIHL